MRHLIPAIVLALAAGACTPQQNDAPVPTGVSVPAAPANAFYVGTWAASEAQCANAAWVIHPTALQGPGGACKFTKITPVQTGYALDAQCIWRTRPTNVTIQAAYAQSAKALLLSGTPEGDVGLVACPQQP